MDFADLLPARIVRATGREPEPRPDVAVLEDKRELGDLAVELCRELGLRAVQYTSVAAYNAVFRDARPRLLILDWRLEREVAAAVYLSLRNRFASLPIVIWTASGERDLPDVVSGDPHTRLVRKSSGVAELESAIRAATGSAGSPIDQKEEPA